MPLAEQSPRDEHEPVEAAPTQQPKVPGLERKRQHSESPPPTPGKGAQLEDEVHSPKADTTPRDGKSHPRPGYDNLTLRSDSFIPLAQSEADAPPCAQIDEGNTVRYLSAADGSSLLHPLKVVGQHASQLRQTNNHILRSCPSLCAVVETAGPRTAAPSYDHWAPRPEKGCRKAAVELGDRCTRLKYRARPMAKRTE